MQRYQIYRFSSFGFFGAKLNLFNFGPLIKINSIKIIAGLYKPSGMLIQHNLIVAALTGKPPSEAKQLHGKRQHLTASLVSDLFTVLSVYQFLDKFIHELIPRMSEFKTLKLKKNKVNASNYSVRIRQKLRSFDYFEDLVESVMHDSHKGIFIPLSIHLRMLKKSSHTLNESYMHFARLPIFLFVRRYRPAFDDLISFSPSK